MVQGAEQQHSIKAVVIIAAQVQGITLDEVDGILRGKLFTEDPDVFVGQLQGTDPVTLPDFEQKNFLQRSFRRKILPPSMKRKKTSKGSQL